jgi:NADPH:quinone reductase-like Zn-dependent oxidoreductase
MVRSIGADQVIDYATHDMARTAGRYDMVIDVAGTRLVTAYRQVLARDAAFVVVGGPPGRWLQPAGHLFASLGVPPFVPQRVAWADVVGCPAKQAALRTLTELIEDGRLAPVIDRRYPFDDLQRQSPIRRPVTLVGRCPRGLSAASQTPLCRAASAKNYPQAVNILVDTWWISTDLGG